MTVRRRAMPAVLTLLSLLLDTSVIPFLISSPYIVSLTFSTVLVLGVYLGRMHGMLYGSSPAFCWIYWSATSLGSIRSSTSPSAFSPASSPMSQRTRARAGAPRASICAAR